MELLSRLADDIVQYEEAITTLAETIADKKHELLVKMLESEIPAVAGTLGQVFKTGYASRYDFSDGAIKWAEAKGLTKYFETPPQVKITKTKMDALLKKGLIDHADYAWLENNHCLEICKEPCLKMTADKTAVLA